MNLNVSRIDRCEKCGSEGEYVVRAENVNSCLTDADILKIISAKSEQPQGFDYCDNCEMRTLTTSIAFLGV
jgi:hypothetical protein